MWIQKMPKVECVAKVYSLGCQGYKLDELFRRGNWGESFAGTSLKRLFFIVYETNLAAFNVRNF
jgi:hypothetical protein